MILRDLNYYYIKLPYFFLLFVLFHGGTALVQANNIQVTNVQRDSFNVSEQWAQVKFDITWENSWRTALGPANWDAAWVFVKFRVGGSNPQLSNASSSNDTITVSSTAKLRPGMPVRIMSGSGTLAANSVIKSIPNDTQFVVSATPTGALSAATIECIRIWEHAYLDTIDSRHLVPEGSTLNAPNDSTGAFIYRSQTGFGTFSLSGVRLRWKWGSNGIAPPNTDTVDIRVFAVEMVYVPQGSFYVGTPDGLNSSFGGNGGNESYLISSSNLELDDMTGLWATDYDGSGWSEDDLNETGPINDFPNGFKALYAMKYEMSQGQYRDFLNMLSYHQQENRTINLPYSSGGTPALVNNYRNGIDIQNAGDATALTPAVYGCNLDGDGNYNESDDGEWIPCNYLNWMDLSAYLDWAGLRPMTELEFEKICRGPVEPPMFGVDYAWGTGTKSNATYTLSNDGTATETISANYETDGVTGNWGNQGTGPLRCGIFAGHASNTGRVSAGASYYGIMELSGNLLEMTVCVGNSDGLAYTGQQGNGSLSAAGHANTSNWPGLSSDEVTGSVGSGRRGGSNNCYSADDDDYAVSCRIYACDDTQTGDRSECNGGRGLRTAP